MSIWIDLLFMHGHFATPRALAHLLEPAHPGESPSVPGPDESTSADPAAAEVAVIAYPAEPATVDPGAFARSGAFVNDPVAITWPSAPVHHPLRVLGQLP